MVHILILEDDARDFDLVVEQVHAAYPQATIKRAEDRPSFESHMEDPNLSLVISDYMLTDYSGLQAFLHCQKARSALPFVFVTGALDSSEQAKETVLMGATGFVLKNDLSQLQGILQELQLDTPEAAPDAQELMASAYNAIRLAYSMSQKHQQLVDKNDVESSIIALKAQLMILRTTLERSCGYVTSLIELMSARHLSLFNTSPPTLRALCPKSSPANVPCPWRA